MLLRWSLSLCWRYGPHSSTNGQEAIIFWNLWTMKTLSWAIGKKKNFFFNYWIIFTPCLCNICCFFRIGCWWVAWTDRICWEFEVRVGLELHGVSIACEACRGTCQGSRSMGRPAPMVKLVRIKVRYWRVWPRRVQEYPKGWRGWAHVDLSSFAKHVSIAHFLSSFFCWACINYTTTYRKITIFNFDFFSNTNLFPKPKFFFFFK